MTRIALIGLGEVGRVLAEDLTPVAEISAWDTAFSEPSSRATRNAAQLSVRIAESAPSAVTGADLVISAVTAANDVDAARSVTALAAGTWFLDVNSASPGQKQDAAAVIEQFGARYVEAAVMSPIEPKRLGAPMLLGGPHASPFADFARPLGFAGLECYSDVVGPASATKLARSIVVKGLEALLTESLLTARAWGVEDRVLASLSNLLPGADWHELAHYMVSRSLEHGVRRSEEMYEAAATAARADVEPLMSIATARRQAWAGAHADALDAGSLAAMLDAIAKASS